MAKRITQPHHLIYGDDKNPELSVYLYKGEHHAITLLERYSGFRHCRTRKISCSKGLIATLRFMADVLEPFAQDLKE